MSNILKITPPSTPKEDQMTHNLQQHRAIKQEVEGAKDFRANQLRQLNGSRPHKSFMSNLFAQQIRATFQLIKGEKDDN